MDSFDTKPFQYSSCTSVSIKQEHDEEISNCANSSHNRSTLWNDEGNEVLQPLVVVKVEASENDLYNQENDKTGCVDPLAHGFQEASLFVQGNNAHKGTESTECSYHNSSDQCTEQNQFELEYSKNETFNKSDKWAKNPDYKTYFCKCCTQNFHTRGQFLKHLHVGSDIWTLHCNVCQQSFKRRKHLLRHQLSLHNITKPHVCYVCDDSFKLFSSLREHKQTHAAEPWQVRLCTLHVCLSCDESFMDKTDFSKHKSLHKNPGEKKEQKAEPTSDKNLNMSCKNTKKKLDISSCNQIVYENHDLAQKTPYTLRPETYICEFCNRCFALRAELLKHSHSHVELWLIKPFVCKVCGESFRSSSGLKEHEQDQEVAWTRTNDGCV